MIGSVTSTAPEWRARLGDLLPLFGHRNWIVVADSAYPAQSKPGIETIVSGDEQIPVVRHVLDAMVYADKEIAFVPEIDAPGIEDYRKDLEAVLRGARVEYIPH